MEKLLRGELICRRFKAKHPSLAVVAVATQPKRAKWWETYSTGKISRGSVATGLLVNESLKTWVQTPERVEESLMPKPLRMAKESPLMRIAARYHSEGYRNETKRRF